ncbi:Hsp20/alpha crystallin family protein [uncultured Metabacillus sp.]|uniref:Hsp20/alpha crystallin family protein n=1 Tax=uncultured Metabacillus sp. TaxID=2860135 RepID=UPI002633F5B7|nr:Hsp20/alpha crystallin family protein [uncultured Metabacillus sp.]
MNIRKCSNPMNINGIEEWMTQFFIDPFTSLLDEHTFRVDLFETSEEFIIEAELREKKKENIHITAVKEKIMITVRSESDPNHNEQSSEDIIRKITLPIVIEDKDIHAIFNNGILEIKIAKNADRINKRTSIAIDD